MYMKKCFTPVELQVCNFFNSGKRQGPSIRAGAPFRINKVLNTPGRAAQSVARPTQEPEVPGSIPGPATYFRFSFR